MDEEIDAEKLNFIYKLHTRVRQYIKIRFHNITHDMCDLSATFSWFIFAISSYRRILRKENKNSREKTEQRDFVALISDGECEMKIFFFLSHPLWENPPHVSCFHSLSDSLFCRAHWRCSQITVACAMFFLFSLSRWKWVKCCCRLACKEADFIYFNFALLLLYFSNFLQILRCAIQSNRMQKL